MATFKKGYTPWNKGKKGEGNSMFGKKLSKKHKKKLKLFQKGIKFTKEQIKKAGEASGLARIGLKRSILARQNMSKRTRKGEKSNFWRGGVSKPNELLRKGFEYRLWREAVFIRDNFTCRFCGQKGGELHADHIKQFAYYPELRFAIDNGRTLCKNCHKKTDTYCHH